MSVTTISPQEFSTKVKSGEAVELIDVRTPVEFREVHASMARNVPLDKLNPQAVMQSRNGKAEQPVYFVCRSGGRSAQACEKLSAAGFTNVVSVDGGTAGLEAAGVPVVRGKKAMSLERQVRIVAGFLVLLGAILGYFVNPYFMGLSAFVGAGLMFAGITDTCGMGMMLAKMPWNQCDNNQCSTS